MPTLVEFFTHLAENPHELVAYRADRRGYLESHGLTESQIFVLTSDDPLRIKHAIEYELGHELEPGVMMGFTFRPTPGF